jgi:hypothetical protein
MRKLATVAVMMLSIFQTPAYAHSVKAPQSAKHQTKKQGELESAIEIRVEGSGWGKAEKEEIAALLRAVAAEFLQHHPEREIPSIIVRHSNEMPVVLYDKGPNGEYIVYLCARGRHWYQYVYEFAHELGHILSHYERHAHSEVARRHQWFEEALCEVASLYALKRVGMHWDASAPYAHWGMDPVAFRRYAERFLSEPHRKLTPGVTLAQWFEANKNDLAKSAYSRRQNEVVANLLLPLFEENPEIWEALAYLNPTAFEERFEDHLQAWHDNAPEPYKDIIMYTMHMFGVAGTTVAASEKLPASGEAQPAGVAGPVAPR